MNLKLNSDLLQTDINGFVDELVRKLCLTAAKERELQALCSEAIPRYFAPKSGSSHISTAELENELLAVIHRDGGHYVQEHGIEKAVEDAITLINKERSELSHISTAELENELLDRHRRIRRGE